MPAQRIDINCDLGESFGNYVIGSDNAVFPHITSCNIACGFHAGDPVHIDRTIALAVKHGVRIGAHPGYPDLSGFGRRKMNLSYEELSASIKYQVSAIKGMTEAADRVLRYVKPHGALYNSAANNREEAIAIIDAIQSISNDIALMGLSGSSIEQVAEEKKIKFIREAFADRRYTVNGTLVSRKEAEAVILDPEEAAQQVLNLVLYDSVNTIDGSTIPMKAESICIHGDNPNAVQILLAIKSALKENAVDLIADQ